jgi:hypothetical protein
LTGADVEALLEGVQQAIGPLDKASRTQADHAGVFALGLQSKEVVKGGNTKDPAGR